MFYLSVIDIPDYLSLALITSERTITFAKMEILRDRGKNISTNVSHVNTLIVNNAISIARNC